MINGKTISDNYLTALKQKYNIVEHINICDIDRDFHKVADVLLKYRYEPFKINDRFLFEHFDTDFYQTNFAEIGLNLYNLIEAFLKTNTPLYTLLIITNHFGIDREINKLLTDHDTNDRPTVIKTFINKLSYPSNFNSFDDISNNNITKHAICMMLGTQRSHRSALFNEFKKFDLLSKIATSIKGNT